MFISLWFVWDIQSKWVVRGKGKLQALVYNILPWRKVPENDVWSAGQGLSQWEPSPCERFTGWTGLAWEQRLEKNTAGIFSNITLHYSQE